MEELFLKLVNMSITASWLVLAVVLFRVLLKKAPKYIRVLLWGLVGLRLLCPVSIESPYSLIMPEKTEAAVSRIMDDYVGPSSTHWDITSEYQTAVNSGIAPIYSETGGSYVVTGTTPTSEPTSLSKVLSVVWLIGMAVMALYAIFSYLRLKKKVAPSIAVTKQIYLCDYIDSPFILGVIMPRIYLPSNMDPASAAHVLAHEQAHLKRRDHWWKPLGFALLTVYWFNPVIWLAYILLCRDIEMACDEKVVKELDAEHRKAYSEALLSCSVPRRLIAACPLAFGEVGVKDRIRSVLHYKKPAFWIILVAVIASVAVAVCFMTDPASVPLSDITTGAYREVESITVINGERTYEITTAEGIAYVEELLGEVRVGKDEISQSRSEDRDKTNTIVLHLQNIDTVRTYHFNADCSEVWFNDSVKPTMTYGVKNADLIRQFFESTIEAEANPSTEAEASPFTSSTLPDSIAELWIDHHSRTYSYYADNSDGTRRTRYDQLGSLDANIRTAIMEENSFESADGAWFESHVILSQQVSLCSSENGGPSGNVEVYVLSQVMEIRVADGGLEVASMHLIPAKLTFETYADESMILMDYLQDIPASAMNTTLASFFPDEVSEKYGNLQNLIPAMTMHCYRQAVSYHWLDANAVISDLLDRICAKDGDLPDLISDNVLLYDNLVYYGQYTLEYAFRNYLYGNLTQRQMDVLATACYDICQINGEEVPPVQPYYDGESWFDAFRDQVDAMLEEGFIPSAHDGTEAPAAYTFIMQYAPFGRHMDELLDAYVGLDTSQGLVLYMWDMEEPYIGTDCQTLVCFGLAPAGSSEVPTLIPAAHAEMKLILSFYDIGHEDITVCNNSSYDHYDSPEVMKYITLKEFGFEYDQETINAIFG